MDLAERNQIEQQKLKIAADQMKLTLSDISPMADKLLPIMNMLGQS